MAKIGDHLATIFAVLFPAIDHVGKNHIKLDKPLDKR